MPTCGNCGDSKIELYPKGIISRAKRCPNCFTKCKHCGGDGFIFSQDEKGREFMNPCDCAKIDRRIELFNLAGIPAHYFDATFENFKTLGNQSLQESLHIAKFFIKNYQAGNWKGLLFMGGVGVGKTRLVSTMIRELTLEHGVPCLFKEFSRLLSEIKSGYDRGISESSLLEKISSVDILVVDELGKGRKSEWETQILDQIISHRYNMQKTTIFTSNYTDNRKTTYQDPKQVKDEQRAETLEERVYSRIYSRLRGMCDFIVIEAVDFRQLEGQGV